MVFTQHQKFLLKHQKYRSPDCLKIFYPIFYDQYFCNSGQNLRSVLYGMFFARSCFSGQPSARLEPSRVMTIGVSTSNQLFKKYRCGFVYGLIPSNYACPFTPCKAMGKKMVGNYNKEIGENPKKKHGLAYPEMKTIFFQTRTFYRLKLARYLSILYQGNFCKLPSVISPLNCYPLLYLEKNSRCNLGKQWITIKKDNYKLSNSIKNYIFSINESNIYTLAKRQRFIRNSLKGILLVNFPEKEKNFLIKNLAAENKIPLITQSASLLLKDSRNMDDLLGVDDPIQILFDKIKTCIPCICFINNLDRIGKQRDEHTRLGNHKSLHWLNYSIAILINNNRANEIIASKSINKSVFSTSMSEFVMLKGQKPLKMHLQVLPVGFQQGAKEWSGRGFDKQTKKIPVPIHDPRLFKQSRRRNIFKHGRVQTFKCFKILKANFDFKPHHLKAAHNATGLLGWKNKQKFKTNYYHRFPVWLSNFQLISHPKISTEKIKWFRFYNNVYTPPKVNFYLESSGSVAWKFWVFNKKLTRPMKIIFFQTLSSKIQLVSKKPKFKTFIASASAFKTRRSFVISKLKYQTAEKKSLKLLSISDHLSINNLSSRLLFIDYFSQTKPIKEEEGISMYDPYTNSNEFIFQNFLRQSNKFEMLRNKIEEPIPKINTNFMSSSKKKNLMITNDYFKKHNRFLKDYNLLNNHGENKIIVSKISKIPNKTNTKRLIFKQSQLDKYLNDFFLATVFDDAQARSRIFLKHVVTKDVFNTSKQNIIFKTNHSLIQKRSVTETLSTNQGIDHNKNNSCELNR